MTADMHPCPQCGAPLRWIPEAGFWNCDQCGNRIAPNAAPATPPPQQQPPPQQGYPPQQQGYPPQGYQPQQGYGHHPQYGGPRKGKGKLVAIIAAVGALAAGGIVLAVVLSKRGSGDGGGGGAASPEELAKTFIAALASGDGDKLVSLSPSVDTMIAHADCPADALEKNKKQYTETIGHSREAAPRFKGHGLVYKSLEPLGERKDYKEGDDLGEGCKVKKPFAMHNFMVEFEYDGADKSKKTFKTNMFTMILGDVYYVSPGHVAAPDDIAAGAPTTPDTPTTPPPDTPPPDTPTAPPDLNAAIAELEKIRSAACSCTDKACADAETANLMAAGQKYTDLATKDPVAKDKLTAIANDIGACVKKFATGATPPPDTPTTPPEPGQGLPECEAYAKAAERFIKCSKVAKQSQEAVRTAVDTMRKNWGDPSKMSDDQKKSAAETCITLEKSMKDAAAAMGCK